MGSLLTGQLAHVFLVAILDAAVVSWVTLRWYRRSVRRLMRERGAPDTLSTAGEPAPQRRSRPGTSPSPLAMAIFDADGPAAPQRSRPTRPGWRRLACAYSAGAALHASVVTAFFLRFDSSFPMAAWFTQWWVFTWPVVPTLAVLLALSRRDVIRLTLAYVVTGAIAIAAVTLAGQVVRGSFSDAPLTNVYWAMVSLAWVAWLPLSLLVITGWRRIRAVTPLALASTLVFGFALLLSREALTEALNHQFIRSMLTHAPAVLSERVLLYGPFMVMALPVGWIAWRLLTSLATRFERKRFSDVQLIVDCWWFIVTAEVMVTQLSTQYGLASIAAGVAAFAAYRIGVAVALAWLPGAPRDQARTLLLLRVFGYQARTETLFDRVAARWRFHGPVQLIAGVDLAMRTVDPGDLLAFISGNLHERYVASSGEVGRRVASLDTRRDPDGRFRVNEVYCRDDTWQPAVRALIDSTDLVLMDLRGFSVANAGCAFELEQLVTRLPPERVFLVYDQTTDFPLLGQYLADAWRPTTHDRGTPGGQISGVRVERNSWSELELLMRRLLGLVAEEPRRVLAVADLPSA
jgi:hypothetical protein